MENTVTQHDINETWKAIHKIFDLTETVIRDGKTVPTYEIPISSPPTIKQYSKLMYIMDQQLTKLQKLVIIEHLIKGKTFSEINSMIEGDDPNRAVKPYRSGIRKLTKGIFLTGNANTEYLVNDDIEPEVYYNVQG